MTCYCTDTERSNFQFIYFNKNENLCTEHQYFLNQVPDSIMINGKYEIYKKEVSFIDDFDKKQNCFQTLELISKKYNVFKKNIFYQEINNQINIIGLRLEIVYNKKNILQVDFCFSKDEYIKLKKEQFFEKSKEIKLTLKDLEGKLKEINKYQIFQYLIIDDV